MADLQLNKHTFPGPCFPLAPGIHPAALVQMMIHPSLGQAAVLDG